MLMSAARPGISSSDFWMRPEKNVAACIHTSASCDVDGPVRGVLADAAASGSESSVPIDTGWPSRRLQTAFTISSTNNLSDFFTRFRFNLLAEYLKPGVLIK